MGHLEQTAKRTRIQEVPTFSSYAYLNFKGQQRGNYMLDCLLKAGFVPALVIEEDSKLAVKGVAALGSQLEIVKDRFPLPRSMDEMAKEYNLKVVSVKQHNDEECAKFIKESGVDMIVLGDCRIIKDHIINLVPHGIVNVHPGYLPDVKGNNPYIWSIYHDLPCGVTVHFINTGIDEGPIICKDKLPCQWQREGFSFQELLVDINLLCGKLLAEAVGMIKKGTARLEHQPPCNPEMTFKLAPKEVKDAVIAKLSERKYTGGKHISHIKAPWVLSQEGTGAGAHAGDGFLVKTEVKTSSIPGAGCGRFILEDAKFGQVLRNARIVTKKADFELGTTMLSTSVEEMKRNMDFADVEGMPTNAEQLCHFGAGTFEADGKSVYHWYPSFYLNCGWGKDAGLFHQVSKDGKYMHMRAARDLKAGEEILCDYRGQQQPKWHQDYCASLGNGMECLDAMGFRFAGSFEKNPLVPSVLPERAP